MIIETNKSLETVLQEANKTWDEQMQLRPDIYKEENRVHFCFGWLQSSYNHLLIEYKMAQIENPAVTGLNDITKNKTQNYGN